MPIRKRGRINAAVIPSSSLADIAFLLLIFFMVCTIIKIDKGLRLILPAMEMKTPVNPGNLVKILINDLGQILLDGDNVELPEIEAIIRNKLTANDKMIISLQTARGAKYQTYIAVLDQLKKANAIRISISDPVDVKQ